MKCRVEFDWRSWIIGFWWMPMVQYGRVRGTFTRFMVFLPMLSFALDTEKVPGDFTRVKADG